MTDYEKYHIYFCGKIELCVNILFEKKQCDFCDKIVEKFTYDTHTTIYEI